MSKIIVITGAGVGLGRALARRLAADGDQVVLLGRTLSKVDAAARQIGERATAVACDVASPDSVRTAFAEIAQSFPKIDVLINNAAVYEPFLIAEAKDEQIEQAVTINYMGPVLCARAVIPMMEAGGHIINVSSESVGIMPFPHMVMYQSSKAGLETFSEGLRHELAPSGIRVTNIRAGAMIDDEKPMAVADPAAWQRFGAAAAAVGINFRERPITHVNAVTDAFRAVIDAPPSLHMANVWLNARKA